MMLLLIWLVLLVVAAALFFKQTYSRFKKHGVKSPTPVPLLGTGISIMLKREHMMDYTVRMYQQYSSERFYGQYEFLRPMVVIRDLELVKQITIKDFDYFLDHRSMVDETVDPIFGRNLFALKGHEWKNMRSSLSPAFTSSKMRQMLPFMVEVGHQMMKTLKLRIKESNNDFMDIEGKDLTSRFANDVIASCAFGLKIDSLAEEDNVFFELGKAIINFRPIVFVKFFLFLYLPKLTKLLKLTFFPKKVTTTFSDMVLNTISNREKHNIVRPDMINLLMEAKKGKLVHDEKKTQEVDTGFATVEESSLGTKTIHREWTDNDLVAQSVLFFLAGFETVSTAMCFALHEMALNPEMQDRLFKEIKENEAKNDGKFDYKSIQTMTYMDMVVSEVLRLWGPPGLLDRLCTKDYNLGKPNNETDKDFYIHKGESIAIPAWAIHHDPKYFPDPYKFDPDRFSEENKHNIVPFSFMPFGLGPRNCIASRFALCEVKVMLYQLLQNFELSPCEKTCIPPVLTRSTFSILLEGGNWVRLKVRV